ncbi:PREDICTED: zinc finger protein 385B-like, partial [Gekko japonicus]|uniref:Zinc finger protein 385B-like n=1 Tax=Gekko japonicus TaxID=146911 RepID=A0ABM1K9B7_GEKJA
MRNIMYFGGTCQSPALPALVRPPAPPLQPSLDIKPFLPFPLDTAAAVNLFPNFNAFQNKNMHISWPQFCNSVISKKLPGLALGREDSKEVGANFGSLLIGEVFQQLVCILLEKMQSKFLCAFLQVPPGVSNSVLPLEAGEMRIK